jgi:hypothetical protein
LDQRAKTELNGKMKALQTVLDTVIPPFLSSLKSRG